MKKFKLEWMPQLPLKKGDEPFIVYADTLIEIVKLQNVIARYDIYQYEHNIKPDFSNAGIISQYNKECDGWGEVDEMDLEDVENEIIPDGSY